MSVALAEAHADSAPPSVTLDHTAYPHLFERVVSHMSRATLCVLRGTSKQMQDRAEATLYRHVEISHRDNILNFFGVNTPLDFRFPGHGPLIPGLQSRRFPSKAHVEVRVRRLQKHCKIFDDFREPRPEDLRRDEKPASWDDPSKDIFAPDCDQFILRDFVLNWCRSLSGVEIFRCKASGLWDMYLNLAQLWVGDPEAIYTLLRTGDETDGLLTLSPHARACMPPRKLNRIVMRHEEAEGYPIMYTLFSAPGAPPGPGRLRTVGLECFDLRARAADNLIPDIEANLGNLMGEHYHGNTTLREYYDEVGEEEFELTVQVFGHMVRRD